MIAYAVNEKRALKHLMDLLRIPGVSGREKQVADEVTARLLEAGCKEAWIKHDQAHKRIGLDFEVGNLIVRMPGTVKGPRRLFSAHLDTVPLCEGAQPLRKGRRIESKGDTALGADNRTAVACLVSLAEALIEQEVPHPPLTLLFTVGEELGILGAKHVKPNDLGNPTVGFNVDAGAPHELVTAAIGAYRWKADVYGKASHAGVHPDRGISAVLIAARAIEQIADRGFFGLIQKGQREGTSNVGEFKGGGNTNQVTQHVHVTGECRSHDPVFLEKIVEEYREAFARAAESVRNHDDACGQVHFECVSDYQAFSLSKDEPVVQMAVTAARVAGMEPVLKTVNGGLDANYLNAHGIPTVTIGAGQHNPHTLEEYVDIDEFLGGCNLALILATA